MFERKAYPIQDVAIYLRKSRADAENELDKHANKLVSFAEKQGWKYTIYSEIGSSDSIDYRPQFKKLLNEIQEGRYDAVLVMDYDRLGRGELEEQGKIKRIFRDSQTLLITPERPYDFQNDEDDTQIDYRGMFARLEYKTITKRLQEGKKYGAKMGFWTNGPPPYPYIYNKITKKLEVDETKRNIYRMIIDRSLEGHTALQIAWELNKKGIQSPAGKLWSENAVYRLVHSQVHMGKIVYNKTRGSGHKNRKTKPLIINPKSSWEIIDSSHEVIKTEAEHNRILELYAKRKIIPKASRRGAFILSGLVYCGKCNRSMQFTRNGKSNKVFTKKCQHRDPFGENKCNNRGINVDILIDAVFAQLAEQEDRIRSKEYDVSHDDLKETERMIFIIVSQIENEKKAAEKIQIQFEVSDMDIDMLKKRMKIRKEKIEKLESELSDLRAVYERREQITDEQRLESIKVFREIFIMADSHEAKNLLFKTVINKIVYTRDDNDVKDIYVHFP